MNKETQTTSFGDALLEEGCITSAETEVDTVTEYELTDTEDDYIAADEYELPDADERDFNDNIAASEYNFVNSDEVHDFNFEDWPNNGEETLDLFGVNFLTPHYSKIDVITELAKFGQCCTTQKQHDTILDLMWMCAMDSINK